jgi:hypothetical protein
MEGITRLVSESLARHGFDRPLDYRRLHWSRWFRCESHHSLLSVPSKPGVFALAEEVMDLGSATVRGGADAAIRPAASTVQSEVDGSTAQNRMLAVTQFFEADDMAFVLDRMLSRENPMRARLASGRYFVRFVAIEDESPRRSICAALNQWIANSGEKVSGIGTHFASSDQSPTTARVGAGGPPATAVSADARVATDAFVRPASEASSPGASLGFPAPAASQTAPNLDSGAASNLHCPHPLPSGF